MTFQPSPPFLLLRGVYTPGKINGLYLPDNLRYDAEQEFVVLAAGRQCDATEGDRVITVKHPGVTWQPDAPDGPVLRIVREETEVLAIINMKEGT